ncbi:MAG: excinuclease ABC subunit UvrA [Negativicutes bacterium]|nr:excinuclease ABC subunit UvrA [Negativicutes bacterium]
MTDSRSQAIVIRGARQHNLKNIDLQIPRDRLTVVTGLSGSGKSSLVFDTIYAEGQRRYIESLSSYARQFLGQMEKPDVDFIAGLSPAIAIDQRNTGKNPRSTVGTVTEIYDYLRVLFARIGRPHCHLCGKPVERQTVDQICDSISDSMAGRRIIVLAPLVRGKKGEFHKLLEQMRKKGFLRARVDGQIFDLGEPVPLTRTRRHTVDLVIDRLTVSGGNRLRLAEAIETALQMSEGLVTVAAADGGPDAVYSEKFACTDCQISLPEIEPRLFSFNSPQGACSECSGLGMKLEVDCSLVVPDSGKSLADGAVAAISRDPASYYFRLLMAVARHWHIPTERPWRELDESQTGKLLYGTGGQRYRFTYVNLHGHSSERISRFEGIVPMLERRHRDTGSDWAREEIEKFMAAKPCRACQGARLRPEALSVRVGGSNIYEITALTAQASRQFLAGLPLTERQQAIAGRLLREITGRLTFLCDVGLEYLTLNRGAASLSGGEAQRIRLATQIGSGLTGVLYILDEPSIGLHQRDNARLLETLFSLRDLGNTLIVVEHDEDTIRAADYIVDIGPAAGDGGGEVVAAGSLSDITACPRSITGRFLSGEQKIEIPPVRRRADHRFIEVVGGCANNLRDITVRFPVGCLTAVTGVSGSGKSSLVNEVLYRELSHNLNAPVKRHEWCREIRGWQYVDRVIDIDQSPIGRTPRSNPATYTGLFDPVRELFSLTAEARIRGYRPGRFSFNVRGGRCESCAGDGIIKIEMHFLPDVFVPCEVCKGTRYNRETLEVQYRGYNISQVLNLTVDEAAELFDNVPKIRRKAGVLQEVGLGYIKLGQPATTLSGGEAQRIKLAYELAKRSTGRTLYILDEPTTGLHAADIKKLLAVLHKLVDGGNTVIVIEHNLDVVKVADYVVDLGPEGGEGGGRLMAWGQPEEIAGCSQSYTGQYLRAVLERG